jgi:hypothetical protein
MLDVMAELFDRDKRIEKRRELNKEIGRQLRAQAQLEAAEHALHVKLQEHDRAVTLAERLPRLTRRLSLLEADEAECRAVGDDFKHGAELVALRDAVATAKAAHGRLTEEELADIRAQLRTHGKARERAGLRIEEIERELRRL